jgi:peptidoglycan/xylan/chitin deacetylase (PgdA/CDA1 family)
MKVFILISLIIVFLFIPKTEGATQKKKIIVVFRYDDYSSLSSTDLELKMINIFHKFKMSFTFGVIPFTVGNQEDPSPQSLFPLNKIKADILDKALEAGTVEVALHGYSHQKISGDGRYTEFYGHAYNSQFQKIEKGKRFLEKILNTQITTFIPPWNSYDLNTIQALEKLGIASISSSLDGDAVDSSKLNFLPMTSFPLYLRNSVKIARNISDLQPIIVVLLHDYDFLEINKNKGKFTYQEFVNLLDWISSQKDIHVMTISQTTSIIGDLNAQRFLLNRSAKYPLRLIPPFLSNLGFDHFGPYLSSSTSIEMRVKNWIYVIVFYVVIVLISIVLSFYTGFYMFHKSRYLTAVFRYGLLSLLIFFSVCIFQDLDCGYRGAIILTVLFGAYIGAWSVFFIRRKRNSLQQDEITLKS